MISNLKKRESQLLSTESAKSPLFNVENLYEKVTSESIKYNTNNVKSLLENWENLALDINTAAVKAYYVLEQAYLNDTTSNITTFTHTFVENIVPKVRTGMQLRDLIRRRLGHLKTKLSTKVNTKLKNINNANKVRPPVVAKPITTTPTAQAKTEAAITESINAINKAIVENNIYDRIIENHKKISKRFNVDKYVIEHAFTKAQAKDLVIELCKMIDTYNLTESAKFAVSIENILYLYEKNHIPYERKDILEMASNYFLTMTENVPTMITNINRILENSNLYTKDDIAFAKILQEDKHIAQIRRTVTSDGLYFDEGVIDKLKSFKSKASKTIAYELKHFKLSEKKSPKDFSEVMRRSFADDDDNIIRETPNVLGYVLSVFVVATGFAIGPVIGIISAITMAFLNIKWSREEVDEQIKAYEAHIKKVEGMIDKANKQEVKDRLTEYKEGLENNLEKLKERKETLKADSEVEDEEKAAEENEKSTEESTIRNIALLQYIAENCEELKSSYLIESIDNSISKIPSQYIKKLAEMSIEYPDMINPKKLESILDMEYDNSQALSRRSVLFEAIEKLKHADNKLIVEDTDLYNMALDLYSALFNKKILIEAVSGKPELLHEISLMSKLDMAKEKLKSAASGFHEKEKAMSKGLDMSIENMQDAVKHSMDTENREAVIRNQLLPSASRIIKTAIVSGLAWCVHPALAAIVVISTFVIAKNARENERQIVMDELDVELDMCNRYIKNAEEKNDLKQIRQLLTIKKKLQYEKDRLYYKMKVDYNEKVRPENRHPDDNGGED